MTENINAVGIDNPIYLHEKLENDQLKLDTEEQYSIFLHSESGDNIFPVILNDRSSDIIEDPYLDITNADLSKEKISSCKKILDKAKIISIIKESDDFAGNLQPNSLMLAKIIKKTFPVVINRKTVNDIINEYKQDGKLSLKSNMIAQIINTCYPGINWARISDEKIAEVNAAIESGNFDALILLYTKDIITDEQIDQVNKDIISGKHNALIKQYKAVDFNENLIIDSSKIEIFDKLSKVDSKTIDTTIAKLSDAPSMNINEKFVHRIMVNELIKNTSEEELKNLGDKVIENFAKRSILNIDISKLTILKSKDGVSEEMYKSMKEKYIKHEKLNDDEKLLLEMTKKLKLIEDDGFLSYNVHVINNHLPPKIYNHIIRKLSRGSKMSVIESALAAKINQKLKETYSLIDDKQKEKILSEADADLYKKTKKLYEATVSKLMFSETLNDDEKLMYALILKKKPIGELSEFKKKAFENKLSKEKQVYIEKIEKDKKKYFEDLEKQRQEVFNNIKAEEYRKAYDKDLEKKKQDFLEKKDKEIEEFNLYLEERLQKFDNKEENHKKQLINSLAKGLSNFKDINNPKKLQENIAVLAELAADKLLYDEISPILKGINANVESWMTENQAKSSLFNLESDFVEGIKYTADFKEHPVKSSILIPIYGPQALAYTIMENIPTMKKYLPKSMEDETRDILTDTTNALKNRGDAKALYKLVTGDKFNIRNYKEMQQKQIKYAVLNNLVAIIDKAHDILKDKKTFAALSDKEKKELLSIFIKIPNFDINEFEKALISSDNKLFSSIKDKIDTVHYDAINEKKDLQEQRNLLYNQFFPMDKGASAIAIQDYFEKISVGGNHVSSSYFAAMIMAMSLGAEALQGAALINSGSEICGGLAFNCPKFLVGTKFASLMAGFNKVLVENQLAGALGNALEFATITSIPKASDLLLRSTIESDCQDPGNNINAVSPDEFKYLKIQAAYSFAFSMLQSVLAPFIKAHAEEAAKLVNTKIMKKAGEGLLKTHVNPNIFGEWGTKAINSAVEATGKFLMSPEGSFIMTQGINSGASMATISAMLTFGTSGYFSNDEFWNISKSVMNTFIAAAGSFGIGFLFGTAYSTGLIYGTPEVPKGAVKKVTLGVDEILKKLPKNTNILNCLPKNSKARVTAWFDKSGEIICLDMKNFEINFEINEHFDANSEYFPYEILFTPEYNNRLTLRIASNPIQTVQNNISKNQKLYLGIFPAEHYYGGMKYSSDAQAMPFPIKRLPSVPVYTPDKVPFLQNTPQLVLPQ